MKGRGAGGTLGPGPRLIVVHLKGDVSYLFIKKTSIQILIK
jgi:hypothetical protein